MAGEKIEDFKYLGPLVNMSSRSRYINSLVEILVSVDRVFYYTLHAEINGNIINKSLQLKCGKT